MNFTDFWLREITQTNLGAIKISAIKIGTHFGTPCRTEQKNTIKPAQNVIHSKLSFMTVNGFSKV